MLKCASGFFDGPGSCPYSNCRFMGGWSACPLSIVACLPVSPFSLCLYQNILLPLDFESGLFVRRGAYIYDNSTYSGTFLLYLPISPLLSPSLSPPLSPPQFLNCVYLFVSITYLYVTVSCCCCHFRCFTICMNLLVLIKYLPLSPPSAYAAAAYFDWLRLCICQCCP